MNTIVLKTLAYNHKEAEAASTITPGDLIEVTSADKVQRQSTEGGFCELYVATEDALQGKTITDDYAAADIVMGNLLAPGDEVQLKLKAGSNAAIGGQLIADGTGGVIPIGDAASATVVKKVVGVARAALDLSGSGAVDTLLAVRVL